MNDNKSNLYTIGEEILHAISHGVGAFLSIIGFITLMVFSTFNDSAIQFFSLTIYGITLIALYISSTLYHSLSRTKAREVFQRFDHISIYLLIAGTYTPVSLVIIGGSLGWLIFSVVWTMAIIGIIFKSIFGAKYDLVSTILYVIMGWLIIIGFKTFINNLNAAELTLFIIGGIFYTLGTYFYIKGDNKKWHHGIWHFFVAAGSIGHYFAILLFII